MKLFFAMSLLLSVLFSLPAKAANAELQRAIVERRLQDMQFLTQFDRELHLKEEVWREGLAPWWPDASQYCQNLMQKSRSNGVLSRQEIANVEAIRKELRDVYSKKREIISAFDDLNDELNQKFKTLTAFMPSVKSELSDDDLALYEKIKEAAGHLKKLSVMAPSISTKQKIAAMDNYDAYVAINSDAEVLINRLNQMVFGAK